MPNDYNTMSKPETIPADKANLNQTLIATGTALAGPQELPGFKPFVVVPEGFTAQPLEHAGYAPLPDHIRQTVELHDAKSFIEYVTLFKCVRTRVFASVPKGGLLESPRFEAIFDFHEPVINLATRCTHRAKYTCPLSLAWQTWAGIHGKALSQREFVDFVDDNIPDIVSPKAAQVLELARDFNAHTEVKFASKVNPITGGVSLNYQEETDSGTATGQLKAFDRIGLVIPIFEGGDPVPVEAKVQWVPRDGKLAVTVKLFRPSETKRTAFAEMAAAIQDAIGITVLNGGAL